jgi:hypothetical protein
LGGDLVRIFLKRKHTQFFEKDDLARLRRRPLLQFPNPSARLKISRVDKEGDFIDVIVPSGVNIEDMLDNFVNIPSSSERSILIVPTPGPSSTGELPLVAPNIREHINTTHGPLTAPIGDPTRTCNLDKVSSEGMQSPTNIPNNLPRGRPIFKPWIVGIYEGGNTYNCGVYHPSGICIMRTQLVPQFTESNVIVIDLTSPQDRLYRVPPKRAIYQFCIVCQYILVDKIDPTKHHDVDNEYRRRGYPFPL